MRIRRGFSLVELLVVVGILGILVAILFPYLAKIRESERRVQCADNLKSIMRALSSYANVNNHFYPRVIYDKAHNPNGYVAYTAPDAKDPFASKGGVSPNDVTASLWLLIRGGFARPRMFICPSAYNRADPMLVDGENAGPRDRSNFTSGKNLSYSYASPFSSAPGYKMDDTQPSEFALMADKNPGVSRPDDDVTGPAYSASAFELAKANSNNHRKAGQNVLYADGHVSFQPTPYCGVGVADKRDNIYTALSPIPLEPGQRPPPESNGFFGRDVGPAWTNDSYLVPTDDE